VQAVWPWDLAWLRGELAELAAQHGRRRAELRAYEGVVEVAQRTEFGGEDPLDPLVRGLLEGCAAAAGEYEGMWAGVVEAVGAIGAPLDKGDGPWPPSLEPDEAYTAELQARLRDDLSEA
jgi:hypothetical protein